MSALRTKSIKDVTRRKLRTGLTVAGIAIGVLGLTAVGVASSQLKTTLQSTNDTSGLPDIQFITAPASASVVDVLNGRPNVKVVQAQTYVPGRWSTTTGHATLTIVGLSNFNDQEFNKFSVKAGQLPGPNEILMEAGDRSLKSFDVGDQIELQVSGSPVSLRVSGIAQTPGVASASINGRGFAYMRQDDLQALYKVPGPNVFNIRLTDFGQRAASAEELAQVLQANNVVVLQSTVGHDITGGGSSLLDGIFIVMNVLSLIALLLSVFLLLSTITTLLAEQVPIIGTMKAIGASRGQVMRNYLAGVAIYGIAGTVIGFGLGLLAGALIVGWFGSLLGLYAGSFSIPPALVVEAIVVGVGVPLLAALIPLNAGTKITVKQALSGYGVEHRASRHGGAWSRAVALLFGFLPQTVQFGARNVFRRRVRAVLTVIALAISGAAFLAVQTTSASFDNVLKLVFDNYHADVWASLSNPQPLDKVQPLVASVPGVNQVDPGSFSTVQTKWGQAEVVGLPPNSRVYRQNVLQGRWFTAEDQGAVLINESVAEKTGLKVGDSINFHNDLNTGQWQIIGVARDYNNPLGLGIMLAPLSQVNAFQHLPSTFVQTMLITSTSSSQADIDALSKRVDDTLAQAGLQASVTTTAAGIAADQSAFLILYVLFYSVVAIVALVGAIGLFNALAMGVLERRREIGILRSMGATGRKVAQVFLAEGVGLGVVGWLAGIVIGIPAAFGFIALLSSVLLRVPFSFNPMSLVVMLAFIVAVASIASLGPVWVASRVKIAQTLRYE